MSLFSLHWVREDKSDGIEITSNRVNLKVPQKLALASSTAGILWKSLPGLGHYKTTSHTNIHVCI